MFKEEHKKNLNNTINELHLQIKNIQSEKEKINLDYLNFISNDKFNRYPKDLAVSKEWRDIGIFVHIFNLSLWDEIYSFIKNLDGFGLNLDLFVNISANDEGFLILFFI